MPKLKGLLDTAKAKLTGLLGDASAGNPMPSQYGGGGFRGESRQVASVPSAPNERFADNARVYGEYLGETLVPYPVIAERLGERNIPTSGLVMQNMLALSEQPQITDSVVSNVPVDMVDMLGAQEFPPNSTLHNQPVFVDGSAIDRRGFVPGGTATPLELGFIGAGAATEHGGGFDVPPVSGERLGAEGAGELNLHLRSVPQPSNAINPILEFVMRRESKAKPYKEAINGM